MESTVRAEVALKGKKRDQRRRVRISRFRKPATETRPRCQKRIRKSIPSTKALDEYNVIISPVVSEDALKKVEDHNTLVFLCHVKATKSQIKRSVKQLYGIDSQRINTLVQPDGTKKAYIRLGADADATDVANKIGII